MTGITKDDVTRLATLSSLKLTNEETDSLRVDLDNIVSYIEQLSELNTEGVEPIYQVTGLQNVWREDEVQTELKPQDLLDLAPATQDNQIKVPKVL